MTIRPTVYLVDAHSYIYRAYHAIRGLSTSFGLPSQAVFGVTNMLLKVLREKRPEYLAMVFDVKGPTFRHNMLETYKANRPPMPEDLSVQIPYIKQIILALSLPCVELASYEADDLIATMARRMSAEGFQVIVVSGDKDLTQLLSESVTIWDPMKDRRLDPEAIEKEYGLKPEQMVDVYSLTGDAVDNVPGVPGIGPKTAVRLIREFQSIEDLFCSLEKVDSLKLREKLKEYKDQVLLSKELVKLEDNVPLDIDLLQLRVGSPDRAELKKLFAKFEFARLLKDLEAQGDDLDAGRGGDTVFDGTEPVETCRTIDEETSLAELLARLETAGGIRLVTAGSVPDPMRADIVGIALCGAGRCAGGAEGDGVCYLPVPELPQKPALMARLSSFLLGTQTVKVGYDLKYDLVLLRRHNIPLVGPFVDIMVAAYLLNPTGRPSLRSLAVHYLDAPRMDGADWLQSFHSVPGADAARVSCTAVRLIDGLAERLLEELGEKGLSQLFHEVEMPILEVLASMEMTGIKIDVPFLNRMSDELDGKLTEARERITTLAGCEFNINSQKQLGEILFEKLNLPSLKKTRKTGSYATDAGILEELSLYHPLPAEILQYRNLSKLKATYVDALPRLVNPATGRLHTYYNQTVTATGRLSSSEPNIQNIPVRSEEGRRVRQAFITDPGWTLISFDYSQIELRVLAHFARDEGLTSAFERGEDVHTMTAADIFNVFPQMVTPEMRRVAKTINFGVAYGMSPFGLAQELRIGRKEAQAFIDAYFTRYRGVKRFMEEAIASARETGSSRTLLNRYRPIPDISDRNSAVRQFAERTAINTPIQGTAADIMKVAMIRVSRALGQSGSRGRMLMQVHDELILEVPDDEAERIAPLVKVEMEAAAVLSVPLVVNVRSGHNWAVLE